MRKKLIFLVVAVLTVAACEPRTGNIEDAYTLGPTAVVVGDSLSNGGRTSLHAELGRHFASKLAAVAGATYGSMRRYSEPYSQDRSDIAVIALGTNDRQLRWILADSLADLNQTYDWFGDSCTVGVTITTDHADPAVNAKAAAINEAAAARADIMVDWDAVDHEPGMTQLDGTHPTAEGYQRRAEMIAEGAETCGENPHVPPTTTTTTTLPEETTTTTTTLPEETTTTTTTLPEETTTTTLPDVPG
jgi:GDSL-like Lipase/Acylhydrolase family